MMIDVKRLAVDAGYWDEVAPDGAETFGPDEGLFVAGWYKQERDGVYFMPEDDSQWQLTYPMGRELIPRPQPQPEWVDGLPPVGCECEFLTTAWRVGRVACYVEGRRGKQGIVQFDNDWQCFSPEDVPVRLRPILTPEQRQRDAAIDRAFYVLSEFREARQVLGELYDEGLLTLETKP